MRYLVSGSTRSLSRMVARYGQWLGFLFTPRNRNSLTSILDLGLPWALDNGAFSGFDENLFRAALDKIRGQPDCLFVVAPDVVANARQTLDLFAQWWPELEALGHPLALVAQDGAEEMRLPWQAFDWLFVGGSTAWKLSRASCDLMAEAQRRGKKVHVGRVNSYRRILFAADNGADSCDGSSASKWGDKFLLKYCCFLRQLSQQGTLF